MTASPPLCGELVAVIWGLLGDRNIVRMALGHAGRGDPAEAGVLSQLLDVAGAAVTHAGAEAADELIDEVTQWAAIGNATLDPLGHELAAVFHRSLAIAVAGAGDHRTGAAHAAIGFVAP